MAPARQASDPSAVPDRERLRRLDRRPARDAAREVESCLERAADPRTPAEVALQLDDAVLQALGDCREPDPILEALDGAAVFEALGRSVHRLEHAPRQEQGSRREAVWTALDVVRRPGILRQVEGEEGVALRSAEILRALESSHLTVGPLFRGRAEHYGHKVLFALSESGRRRFVTWRQAASRVDHLARGLIGLADGGEPGPVAILSENRIEMALFDLACLSSGLVNVMVPATASESDVGYILQHSGARTAIVSGETQLRKVLQNRDSLPELEHIVSIETQESARGEVLSMERLAREADGVDPGVPAERGRRTRIDDLATVMYTSGTTGTPKGIRFSHRNIVSKRFARALALPEIGDRDVFLCFLPLFHTFGRFLEMMGCIFWGAKYCFLPGTSVQALVQGMRRNRPTVFISVPKKWIQLYEAIGQQTDTDDVGDAEHAAAVRRVTGGRLRWGLSAAGYLDPDIFRFFQRHRVELMSGFGMTEATGGITMTPPGRYEDGSLGKALPGIELKLAGDSELLVRGPYVMMGYLDPPDDEPSFDEDGWLHTGDLMQMNEEGYLRLIDRKKEIYKNVKGETIAPQRVENMFRDFESVGRAFLVGDHREYNTLLIYPNPEYEQLDFKTLSAQETEDHFRSLVVSVNKFLAPYERVVDFAVIDRDLDADRDELTPKGTPRRQIVERNFAEVVRHLYRRTSLHVGGLELTLPNWLLQILGLTAGDIRVEQDRVALPFGGTHLTVRRRSDVEAQVGSCLYRHPRGALNLGTLLTTPRLWLGNEELVTFVPLDMVTRRGRGRSEQAVEWRGRVEPYRCSNQDTAALEALGERGEVDLLELDLVARMLACENESSVLCSVKVLEKILAAPGGPLNGPARSLLGRLTASSSRTVRREAFRVLVPAEVQAHFPRLLERFLLRDPKVLDDATASAIAEQTLPERKIEAFLEFTERIATAERDDADQDALAASLLDLLAAHGVAHPVRYRRHRAFLERVASFASHEKTRTRAVEAAAEMERGFRNWLGPSARIAVDPETGQEYRWQDVVAFDEEVPAEDRLRMLSAIEQTAFLREAVFLFTIGTVVRLSDIPPGGIWIRPLEERHGKSIHRITVQTRYHGAYEMAVNLNRDLTPQQVRDEIHWLILCGMRGPRRAPLVQDFGGYWPEQELWSEDFHSGETLDEVLRRFARRAGDEARFQRRWPFLAWAALSAYVDFWHRSGQRLELSELNARGVVVPAEDYQSGSWIVSVSPRRLHEKLSSMLEALREFVDAIEAEYPVIRGLVSWRVVFSAVVEVLGEREGLALFREALQREADPEPSMWPELRAYVSDVASRGFVPMREYFAVGRYRRWATLSEDATLQARALTLRELYDTYGLERLSETHPELRVRFFLETVFRGSVPALRERLQEMVREIRDGELHPDELIEAVDGLRLELDPGEEDEYFLARLSYPYLRPEDAADFVRSDMGGRRQSEIVVTLEDREGRPFNVRHALNPKEVERLYRLFLAAKLDVQFRMEHRYLVAHNERGQIIAGIFYEMDEDRRSAHLEKIVVADRYRRKGVADGLMNEFFNRLRAQGARTVTTGFFRPQYFYGYGFRIEKRYAGLVKSLAQAGDDGRD